MNGLANSNDDSVECPLCMEPLEVDDLTFFPCTCGYQICRFCWHRIRTDENKLCPACRKEYPENPADFKPLTQEEMIAFKSQKRQRDQQRKQKITENRKHLANVRVVQKNLVFVVGLPPRLADADILKKHEYFGKYGKIHKVVINPSTTYAGVQGPSASAYVTYVHNTDALRAIQSVNNIMIDGRLIKTSLGTTKYCSHFMKNQQCPKGDCMYLHELGDPEASFTKEEMHQGKHQEYEKRLHDVLIATSGANNVTGIAAVAMSSSSSSSASSSVSIANAASSANAQQKEAWPSLSVSPVNSKETIGNGGAANGNGKSRKEKSRNEKGRNEKNKSKSKNNIFPGNANTSNKENFIPESRTVTITPVSTEDTIVAAAAATKTESSVASSNRSKTERNNKEKASSGRAALAKEQKESNDATHGAPTETQPEDGANPSTDLASESTNMFSLPKRSAASNNVQRSLSSSSENSDDHVSESSASEESSPGNLTKTRCDSPSDGDGDGEGHKDIVLNNNNNNKNAVENGPFVVNTMDDVSIHKVTDPIIKTKDDAIQTTQDKVEIQNTGDIDCTKEVSDALFKMNIFDDSNSFFSSSPAFQQSLLLRNKTDGDMRQSQINSVTNSHLPDLLNGIDGYQHPANTNEWEEAFQNVMLRNNRHVEEQVLHQQHLQLQQQHHHQQVLKQQEEFLRIHELQKRNNLVNNIGIPQNTHPVDANRSQPHPPAVHPPHLAPQPDENPLNNIFGNMSKFFDFHKSQQQIHQQYMNGHQLSDSHRLALFLENGRAFDNGILSQQSQLQKQRLMGAFDKTSSNQPQNSHSPQNRFTQSSLADDDLGFDPFIETQKGLAELMENEVVQQNVNIGNAGAKLQQPTPATHQQLLDNMQRARMPPPGFNHMNTLGFDGAARVHSSKILPFINMPGGGNPGVGNNSAQLEQQHQLQLAANWNPHLATLHQHPGQPLNDTHLQQMAQAAGAHNKGYSNSDWTSMDPAILSYRQYSSFPHQGQMPLHQQQQDLFLQHLAQNQQQNGQGFSNQSQQVLPGMNMPNNLMNGQSSSQTQVNANVQGMLEFLKNRQFV
ncbi:GH13370 [Drosophila grimshawi]|uniref:CCR4-NOT transcription complex subunit 4 n=1 Tax=Drosophila grimshawi TaxID=7222 RepID=B4JPM8_DROGR|nr:GH13370 [Drosophila grimshawi]